MQSEIAAARSDNDSIVAQAVADREGPRVRISATFEPAAGSRRVRANFHADDDAYVLVGHIDPDGVLRIAFPDQPGDDGFIRGNHSYQTSEFFAGFNDQYNYRLQSGMYRSTAAEVDSYDRGVGYVFIIATWRPMRFDRFATDGEWDSFELADQDYMRDPRPAVYELASLLSGENREAYTVEFARYYNTQLFAGYDAFSSAFGSAYGATYCAGYSPFGFASSPFDFTGPYVNRWAILNRMNFSYRGTYYAYSAFGDCYRPGGYYLPFGANPFGRIAQVPLPPGSRPRGFTPQNHRGPIEPQPSTKVHAALETPTAGSTPATSPSRFSPSYRQRGLITEETGPVSPRGRPGVQAVSQMPEGRSRPGFAEMVNRRGIESNEGTPTYRSRARVENGSSSGWTSQSRPRYEPQNSGSSAETRSRFNPSDNPRSAPAPRESAPRHEAPTRVSSPPPSAPPRMEAPRVESHPVSAPPPSTPPASSSGTPIKPPGR